MKFSTRIFFEVFFLSAPLFKFVSSVVFFAHQCSKVLFAMSSLQGYDIVTDYADLLLIWDRSSMLANPTFAHILHGQTIQKTKIFTTVESSP